MRVNENLCTLYLPDNGGIVGLRISGIDNAKIELALQKYMIPDEEGGVIGLPPDFVLSISPEKVMHADMSASLQEGFFRAHGSAVAREFLINECGMEL